MENPTGNYEPQQPPQPQYQPPQQPQYQPPQPPQQPPVQEVYIPDPADVEKNKVIAGLAYLLFFLPLLACPDSKFGRFHANQALVLWIFGFGGSLVLSLIPIIGWFLLIFYPIAVGVFGIIGLVNGLQGKAKELPLIGKIKIFK
ncbi:MAG: hypothetical protein Q8865_10095 [Bacillota bacterium]|nr:hypothetical protein [Bacillota bacterium]